MPLQHLPVPASTTSTEDPSWPSERSTLATDVGPQTEPFVVDDSRFRRRFGDLATAIEAGARATAEWALAAYHPS